MPSSALANADTPKRRNAERSASVVRPPWLAVALREPLSSVLCLLFLWLILCRHLSSEWSLNEQYSYGWFVPIFVAYLLWLRWESRPQAAAEAPNPNHQAPGKLQTSVFKHQGSSIQHPASGQGPLVGVAALAVVGLFTLLPLRVFELANPDWRPLSWLHALIVVGLTLIYIWYVGGIVWLRHFAFPVAFILVAVPWISPIEEPIVQGLMRSVAAAAAETVSLFGIPAQLEGNLIRLPRGLVGVNEACSGVRSLQTSLMIGLLFGELKRFNVSRRIGLVAGAIGIALFANFLRAVFLVWVAANKGLQETEHWHDIAGYAIVGLVFVGTMGLARALARAKRTEDGGQRTATEQTPNAQRDSFRISIFGFRISAAAAMVVLVWLVSVEIAAAAWYWSHERNLVAHSTWKVRWPESTPGFHEIKIAEGVKGTLRFDEGREVSWQMHAANPGEPASPVFLFFFRWEPGSSSVVRARAHRPDICLPSVGWKQLTDHGVRNYVTADGEALPVRHITFARDKQNVVAHTFFCLEEDKSHVNEPRPDLLVTGGAQPDWSFRGRTEVVKNGVRNLGQQVLEVVMLSAAPMSDEAAEQKFAEIVKGTIVKR